MVGDWISVRAHAGPRPARFAITFAFGALPDGWARSRSHARTWAGLLGLVCIAPFATLLVATVLRSAGVEAPYAWISTSEVAILAASLSLFVGIPIAIAVNVWRIGRVGVKKSDGALEGLIALEFAPLHLFVVAVALAIAVLFVGHLAADSYACLNGVHSAC